MCDGYVNTMQNAKIQHAKKQQHSFCNNTGKKNSNSAGEKPKRKYACIKNANNKWKRQAFMKKRIIGIITHEINLASGANDEKVPKLASNRISEFF